MGLVLLGWSRSVAAERREDVTGDPGEALGAQALTLRQHRELGTNAAQEGPFLVVDMALAPLRFLVSRTSAFEYLDWLGELDAGVDGDRAFLGDAARDGVVNLYAFGLDWGEPSRRLPHRQVMPRQVVVPDRAGARAAIEFVRTERSSRSRILYELEVQDSDGDWQPVDSRVHERVRLGQGLERVTLLHEPSLDPTGEALNLRLVVRYEPRPAFYAHYMSDLNPGWSAMGYIAQPVPAFFRLFYEQPGRMQKIPRGKGDYFNSTGGLHRDLPLLPPGFAFGSARESAELEIRRALRAGVDGFAVNCMGGRTDFVEALFQAAVGLAREEPDAPPFAITLSIDINVIPHPERRLLVAVGDLIERWLEVEELPEHRPHLARRGGKPLLMGYQSHWIWIDYLTRLLELWELREGLDQGWHDKRLAWLEELGPVPSEPCLPEEVVESYRHRKKERLEALDKMGRPMDDDSFRADYEFFLANGRTPSVALRQARESLSRRHARSDTVRQWARHPDAWPYIKEAYRVLERRVGKEIFWQFDAVDLEYLAGDLEKALRVVGRDFPAVNMFLPKGNQTDIARRVVREVGAEWGEPLFTQYVAYGQNQQDGQFWGNTYGGDGTATLRNHWYEALGENWETGKMISRGHTRDGSDTRSSLIQYTTWNDYVEHSHLAPSLQLRYSLLELNRYFIANWKTGGPPEDFGERIFLFYRKYSEAAQQSTFPFWHAPNFHPARFEVITVLDEGGELELLREESKGGDAFRPRAETRSVGRGFQVEQHTGDPTSQLWEAGKVKARVTTREGKELSAVGWEEITDRPFRQDDTLVGACSRCDDLWSEDAPEEERVDFRFSEYGDVDQDGLPNWFEMLYFGAGWLQKEDQERAKPHGDENLDGKSNLEHYRQGTNPTYFAEPIPYRSEACGTPIPFRVSPRRKVRIPAEEFDRGGPGVAYRKVELATMGTGGYRTTRYDMVPHRQVDGHEEDGGDWMVHPLADGEWLAYTLDLAPGCYRVSVRVREGGGSLRVELKGAEWLEAEIERGGLWTTQEIGRIEITPAQAGRQVMRLQFVSPGYGLNWIQFGRCGWF